MVCYGKQEKTLRRQILRQSGNNKNEPQTIQS